MAQIASSASPVALAGCLKRASREGDICISPLATHINRKTLLLPIDSIMSSKAMIPLRDRQEFTHYIRRLLNMQVKLVQVIHFDVRCHDMAVFEWCVFVFVFCYLKLFESKLFFVLRPAYGIRIVLPKFWADYGLLRDFKLPCCVCPSRALQGTATYQACNVVLEQYRICRNKWIARCAELRCGYYGKSYP